MAKNFLSINSNYNDFLSRPSSDIDKYLLENNNRVLSKLYGFLQKSESLLVLTGFQGTGKKQLINHLLNYVDKDVESFKFYCSNSTTLDDLLLLLWSQIMSVTLTNGIKYDYAMTFQDKVSVFFVNSDVSTIITLYDYDLLSDTNHKEILDFLLFIARNRNIKIILTSKTFDTSEIPDTISYTKVIVKAFSRVLFEKYLNSFSIKSTSRMFDELYKITRGYFLYTKISKDILNIKLLNISNYLVAYTNSGMSFDSFLAKAYISMLSDDEQKMLAYFSVIRHPLNTNVLNDLNINGERLIKVLNERGFINIISDKFYINEYFRNPVIIDTDEDLIHDIRLKVIEFYEKQLECKPSERSILLSRNTMRSEIEYHKTFLTNESLSNNISISDIENLTSLDLLSRAETLLEEYQYQDALKIYLILLEKQDIDKIDLYKKLAKIYERMGNTKYAMYYLNLLLKYYSERNDIDYVDECKFAISRIYYQTYKTNDAIRVLNEIISESNNVKIIIDAYTLLANLYISLADKNKAFELYSKAIEVSEQEKIYDDMSELYFKFAILADEKGDTTTAIKYYTNCIEVSQDDNKYKSLSFSNLGDFYLDIANKEKALENFQSAYCLDMKNSNDYGVYYSASNIAKILIKQDPNSAYQYLLKAHEAALKSKDIFAIANSGLHLGDYFSNNNLLELALKEYFSVLDLVKDKFSNENKNKIRVRINDIKYKLGEEKFNELYGHSKF